MKWRECKARRWRLHHKSTSLSSCCLNRQLKHHKSTIITYVFNLSEEVLWVILFAYTTNTHFNKKKKTFTCDALVLIIETRLTYRPEVFYTLTKTKRIKNEMCDALKNPHCRYTCCCWLSKSHRTTARGFQPFSNTSREQKHEMFFVYWYLFLFLKHVVYTIYNGHVIIN